MDNDEDFEYAGSCIICEETLDMSEAGFCGTCGQPFCWGHCGSWKGSSHCCNLCSEEDE